MVQGKSAMRMYHDFEEQRSKGDFSILPELHVTLSGMKVMPTCLPWAPSAPCICFSSCSAYPLCFLPLQLCIPHPSMARCRLQSQFGRIV